MRISRSKRFLSGVALVVTLTGGSLAVSACGIGDSTSTGTTQSNTGQQAESAAQNADNNNLMGGQPVPIYKFSVERQELIDIENIRALGQDTTTFFFNQGVTDPISSCSSRGMPIPADTQLTNPQEQVEQPDGGGYNLNRGDNVISQADPTGTYTGPSTGTYVLCINSHGQAYLDYWEGFVQAVSGPATWDKTTHTMSLLGSPDKLTTAPSAIAGQ